MYIYDNMKTMKSINVKKFLISVCPTAQQMNELEGILSSQDLQDFIHNLPGFLLTYTSEGKLIYVSENVTDHLGHSMVS